jgi:protein involved in polysaccharide export with SLBB domain
MKQIVMKSWIHGCWLVIVMGMAVVHTESQELFKAKDLTGFTAEKLSEEELIAYRQQLQKLGISETTAEQLAIRKGLSSSELIKLRARLAWAENDQKIKDNRSHLSFAGTADSGQITQHPLVVQTEKRINSPVFGSELFMNNQLTFEPDLRLPTPRNYIIGPDDELVIDIFGYQEVNLKCNVSAEGLITIPFAGMFSINGLSFEQATKKIRHKMEGNGYASLRTGLSHILVSIGRIRSIKVTVIGDVKRPGTYTLPSLASLFNALYAAGGPTDKGSMREIEVIRNNVVVEKLDAYQFLIKGDQTHNTRLADQDVVRIPVAKIQVTLGGEIKRPGVYEMLPGETFSGLLVFAGGFAANAYKASVQVIQVTDKEKQIKDITKETFTQYLPVDGDSVLVGKIINRVNNRVQIRGAVYRPGEYEWNKGLQLSQLIQRADGLKEDAFIQRGVIVRTREDQDKEVIPFAPWDIVHLKQDIPLFKEDEILIALASDYKESYTITIEGEVRKPGVYTYYDKESLKDLLFAAGGFTDVSSVNRIEIARRLEGDGTILSTSHIVEILEIGVDNGMDLSGKDTRLRPMDIIIVHAKSGFQQPVSVQVEGEIYYPGVYVLTSKTDHVSTIIQRAGGIRPEAFAKGVSLQRINKRILKDSNDLQIKKMMDLIKDSSGSALQAYTQPTIKIGLNMGKILENPGGNEDILLQEGDIITVPAAKKEIKITGEVLLQTEVVYKKGESLGYYINKAGGFTDNARRSKVYVLHANGIASKTCHVLFFRNYPAIEEGSEILVPKMREKRNRSLAVAELLAVSTGIVSLVGLLIALIRL